jgi:Flp pilus assembly pilin Flp
MAPKAEAAKENTGMDLITRMFVKAQNWQKGQTMTEYALILAAVAVVVYAGYKTMGTSITGLLTSVDGNL